MSVDILAICLPIAIIVVGVVIGVVLRALMLAYVKRHAADPTRVDVAAFRLARGFVLIWMVLAAVAIVAGIVPLSALVRDWLDRFILALAYGTITAFLIAATVRLMRRMGERLESFRPVEGMAKRVTQITLGVIGGLLILNALTIPITPLLTTLGVAGLATALALQDTLSNFFAGFYLLADRPIRAGDFIKLDTGHEGYVLDVGWRTTKLRTLPNTVVVLPNSKLSQSIITNYSLPEGRMGASLKVSVAYDSDIDRVEQVLHDILEEAKAEIPTLLADPPPGVAFSPGFGEWSLDFTLAFQIAQYVDQFRVQNELRKRIYRRFRDEGIEFPFPTRTLRIAHEASLILPPRDSTLPQPRPSLQ